MQSITELSPVRAYELKQAARLNQDKANEVAKLMADLIAKAYYEEDQVHYIYFQRADDVLFTAREARVAKAILKKVFPNKEE